MNSYNQADRLSYSQGHRLADRTHHDTDRPEWLLRHGEWIKVQARAQAKQKATRHVAELLFAVFFFTLAMLALGVLTWLVLS